YSEGLATGLIAGGGTLGIVIPPSITLILYRLASEQSIGRLFSAGIGAGILLVFLFAFWVMFKYGREPKSALAAVGSARHAITEDDHFTWRDGLESLPRLLPFLILIAVIMIALYGGWATPSEVAGIGAAR